MCNTISYETEAHNSSSKGLLPKKLDINEEKCTDYVRSWSAQVVKSDYDFAIFSVGSGGKVSQQLPEFSNHLGKVAILNISAYFSETEISNVSNSNKVSVNYLSGKICVADRCSLVTKEQRERYIEQNKNFYITQDNFKDSISILLKGEKKVILLSHVSITAPRILFEEVLKSSDIMEVYGINFLFIHSYFENLPTILCSKAFISYLMDPDIDYSSSQYIEGEDTSYSIEILKDNSAARSIITIYDDQKITCATSIDLYGNYIFSNLQAVNYENIIEILGENKN